MWDATDATSTGEMTMSRTELTAAIRAYARRHGHYASTVRTMTSLRLAAIAEWKASR